MHIDAEKALKELVAKGIKLPPQPKVLIELQKILASDDYNMSDVARIISSDPGISAMLFKAARSPVFSSGRTLNSIEQVLMVIASSKPTTSCRQYPCPPAFLMQLASLSRHSGHAHRDGTTRSTDCGRTRFGVQYFSRPGLHGRIFMSAVFPY